MFGFSKNKPERDQQQKAATETRESPYSNGSAAAVQDPPRSQRTKIRLKLLTESEEKDRSYRAAREHFLTHTTVHEVRKQRLTEVANFFWERVLAVGGICLVIAGLLWVRFNADLVMSWWHRLIDSIGIF